jgi:formate--tetrahydrofolate ligase
VPIPSDLEIARAAQPRPISEIAALMGVPADSVRLYGNHIAKVLTADLDRIGPARARYVLVTAVTPTPLGEGKTTIAVGLAQAFRHIGRQAIATLRQPSLGPTFGIKGGAAGGGYSQVIPMEDLNLHLTGDFHAVTAAHNMAAALIDSHLFHGNHLGLDIHNIPWRRVLDVNDRALREVVIGLGHRLDGIPRQTGFDITAASEVMAILALATDLADLRARLGRTVLAYSKDRRPVTADDLGVGGAMAVLLRDALEPNLLQTLEGTPVLVHAGPFANIAHGNCSILADRVAVRGGDYVVTEAGFGADIGAEKFFNIKCRFSGMTPDAAVVVTTVRSMKAQTGNHRIVPGKPIPSSMSAENPDEVIAEAANLRRHVATVRRHGVTPVVAINSFPTDHTSEHQAVASICDELGVRWALAAPFSEGGPGVIDLAKEVEQACAEPSRFQFLYADDAPLRQKIETIASEVYGAGRVAFEPAAERSLIAFEELGWGRMPICMAKTHLSVTHDPSIGGAPTGWTLPIREVRASVGAGFVLAMAGEIRTMPGLGSKPAALGIDLDEHGNIVGLS